MKDSIKNDKKVRAHMVYVRLSEDLHRRLRVLVAVRDETIQVFQATLVAREVERHVVSESKVIDV